MRAAEVWAAYCTSLLGSEVTEALEKFKSLSDSEQAAWEAALQAALKPVPKA